jgi:hypothetical protein
MGDCSGTGASYKDSSLYQAYEIGEGNQLKKLKETIKQFTTPKKAPSILDKEVFKTHFPDNNLIINEYKNMQKDVKSLKKTVEREKTTRANALNTLRSDLEARVNLEYGNLKKCIQANQVAQGERNMMYAKALDDIANLKMTVNDISKGLDENAKKDLNALSESVNSIYSDLGTMEVRIKSSETFEKDLDNRISILGALVQEMSSNIDKLCKQDLNKKTSKLSKDESSIIFALLALMISSLALFGSNTNVNKLRHESNENINNLKDAMYTMKFPGASDSMFDSTRDSIDSKIKRVEELSSSLNEFGEN